MRDYILLYINGRRVKVDDEMAFMPLANFLRYERSMAGTKIVCAEGDCGACTVLVDGLAVNACLMLAGQAEGKEILTIEGLSTLEKYHPIQI